MIAKLETENATIGAKVEGFKSGGIELISEEKINLMIKEQSYYVTNWKKMKKGCKEMVDTISECADLNPKEFIQKLGLETDEEYGADITQMGV